MNFPFKTLHEFNNFFKDEKACYKFMEDQRWEGKPVCPHCGSLKVPYKVKPRGKFKDIPSYRCSERECDLPFSVRTKTIFEGSKVELKKWFHAAYEITTSKKGISSIELAVRIGVSQKTAWFMNHRIRGILAEERLPKLKGTVEVDETYIGGKAINKHKIVRKQLREKGTGYVHKIAVFGMLERDGKVRIQVVDKADGAELKPIIRNNISMFSTVITDGFGAYNNLNKEFKGHEIINHAQDEYVRGEFHTNSIEGFWSQLKRGIYGIYHQVSRKHLQLYCTEFAERYNNRKVSNTERFYIVIQKSNKERITYRKLIANQ